MLFFELRSADGALSTAFYCALSAQRMQAIWQTFVAVTLFADTALEAFLQPPQLPLSKLVSSATGGPRDPPLVYHVSLELCKYFLFRLHELDVKLGFPL